MSSEMETNIVAVERLKEYSETEKEVEQAPALTLGLDLQYGFTQKSPSEQNHVCLQQAASVWQTESMLHIFMGNFSYGKWDSFFL